MQQFFYRLTASFAVALLLQGIIGCVQMPTEKASISDIRPQISLRPMDDSVRGFRVLIDGLDMGAVSDFIEGTAALRIVPGTHVIKILNEGRTILDEKFYVGDGVNRTFIVKRGL